MLAETILDDRRSACIPLKGICTAEETEAHRGLKNSSVYLCDLCGKKESEPD